MEKPSDKPFSESWFHAPLQAVGDTALLPPEEAFHMRKVLRLQPGKRVTASNGAGGVFLCDTSAVKSDGVLLTAAEAAEIHPAPPRLHMILGLLKGKDLEEPVEGLCQANLRAIHLITTDHTQEFKGQNHERLVERLRGKSLVALKQAKKAWLTEIRAPLGLREWRQRFPDMPLILLHPGQDRLPDGFSGDFGVLCGPEGGFSSGELEWLESEGCHRMGLGSTRLRGTHAPLLACGKLMGLGLQDATA
ncbi:MAG TPA: RsmE family RNA methyltransferase [Fibrobacteria bacterium]|nr:RsmE family RNA methyltransferase [Fibrobacteria bacterium]